MKLIEQTKKIPLINLITYDSHSLLRKGAFCLLAGAFSLSTMTAQLFPEGVKLTFKEKIVSISEVLDEIEAQTGYSILVRDIDTNAKVEVNQKEQSIDKILESIFADTGIVYEVTDKKVSIYLPNKTVKQNKTQQENKTIKGMISDAMGPIAGANVSVKGTTIGTITDMNGNFTLEVPAGSILLVSYIGFNNVEMKVGDKTLYNITMTEDSQALEEIVVVGFGTQKKLNLTGAVTAVSGDDLSKRPVSNTATMLQGQVPGLRVNQGSGQPGNENASFRVRGQGTFSGAGSDPLILINGVPGSITNLDPSVIESVSVLKDAASASIYGARAANGVILVTTKQGSGLSDGKTYIGYHGNIGIHNPTRMYDIVTNSVEYMELANIAKTNSGTSGLYSQKMIDDYRNNSGNIQYPNFDWLGYMFRSAIAHSHNLSIAGNTNKTTYNIALNFIDQEGTMRSFDYKKYNVTIDLSSQITDFIKIGTYNSMMYGDRGGSRAGQSDAFLSTLAQAPTYMPWLPDNGSGVTRWTNSAYTFENHNKNIPAGIGTNTLKNYYNFDVNTQIWLDIKLAKGLSWYTKGAARLQSDKSKEWFGGSVNIYDYHTGEVSGQLQKGGLGKGLDVEDARRFYTNLYTYLKYDFIGPNSHHNFNIMAGYSQENEKYETLKAYRRDYVFDLPVLDAGANDGWTNSGKEEEWSIMSLFGRINYNFKERYLLEANIRYDGTSRLASENRWGIFPSFSAGWRITEEDFIKNLSLSWLNNVKIRGSWGQLGNQNIGLYPYQAMISNVENYPFDDVNETVSYQQKAYANRNISWETTTVTDFGLDLQVLNGLMFTFDWYNKKTSDILRSSQVSYLLGMSAPTVNNGEVTNKGVELSLNYNNIITDGVMKGLNYNVGVYLDRSRNKLTKFGSEEISGFNLRREGLPYNSYYMLECIGVFANEDEVKNSPKQFNDNTLAGDLKFKDQNNDGVIDNNDRVVLGGRFPNFEYAINASASWKGFDLSLLTQGISGKSYYTTDWGVQPFRQGTAPSREYLKGMWTPENPDNAIHPKLYWDNFGGNKNTRANSYFLKHASYLRLKNLTFGYTLPKQLTDKVNMSRVRVYFSGDNLVTLTKFKGLDPERDATNSDNFGDGNDAMYPQNRICSFGLNVEF